MLSLLVLFAAHAAAPPAPVLAIPFGNGPTRMGVVRESESSPEGPGSLAVDGDGRFYVLDAAHLRVAVLQKNGDLAASVPLPSDTIEDIALLPSGEIVVLDRLVARLVYILAPNGAVVASAPVEGSGVNDGGEVTALFADATGVWLEVLRGTQVRVLDAQGLPDAARPTRPGLPLSVGPASTSAAELFVRLRKVGDAAQVLVLDRRGALVADGAVPFQSLLELSGLVVSGDRLFVAGHELVQKTPEAMPSRDVVVVVELTRGARGELVEKGRRSVKASPEFVPQKQLVAASPGHVAHLFVDTTARADAHGIEVTSW